MNAVLCVASAFERRRGGKPDMLRLVAVQGSVDVEKGVLERTASFAFESLVMAY